jgi:hypothetical protein
MKRYSDAELQRIKERNPISSVIGRYVTWDRAKTNGSQGDYWACCPFHEERTPSFHCVDQDHSYKCFGCGASGDQFAFLQAHLGLSFVEAAQHLGGEAEAEPLTPEQIKRDAEERARRLQEKERADNAFRTEEINKASKLFRLGGRVGKTEGADYLRGRGLAPLPFRLPLRFHPHFKYWHMRDVPGQKKKEPYVLFSGPVMLAPISGPSHEFLGVHITYIDPARPGEKIRVEDPEAEPDPVPDENGPPVYVAPKKIRGSKRGATIKLIQPKGFSRLVLGEGWETTVSVALAEYGSEAFARTAYWTAIDLQSMGGKSAKTIAHPNLKNKAGRSLAVPGPEPDMGDPKVFNVPDQVTEMVLLGDGDSDRFTAEQVHARAARRFAAEGRTIRSVWAPDGMDFNDLLKAGAA